MKQILKYIIMTAISLIITIVFLFLSSLILANTDIKMEYAKLFGVLINAGFVLLLSFLFARITNVKGIYSALISFAVVNVIRSIITIIITGTIALSVQGIINLLLSLVFSFVGSVIAVNLKK